MRKYAIAIAISLVGQAGVFLGSVITARALTLGDRGLYSLFQVTAGALMVVSGFGLGAGIVRASSATGELAGDLLPTGRRLALLTNTPIALAYALVGSAMGLSLLKDYSTTEVVLLVLFVVVSSVTVPQRQLMLRLGHVMAAKTHGAAIAAGAVPAFAVLWGLGVTDIGAYLATQVLAVTVVLLCVALRLRRTAPPGQYNSALAHDAMTFGRTQYVSELSQYALSRADFFLVATVLGARALGVYAVAVALAEAGSRVPYEIGTMLFPAVARGDTSPRAVADLLRRTLYLTGLAALALALLAGPVLRHVFGPEYAEGATTLRILLVGTVAWAVANIAWNYLSASGRPWVGACVFGSSLLVDVVLALALMPSMGTAGAATAAAITYCAGAVVFLHVTRRQLALPVRLLVLPTRDDAVLARAALRRLVRPGGRTAR